jgi:hypothetical protein
MALTIPQIQSLEERTAAAHRAYIAALHELETVQHRKSCRRCGDPSLSPMAKFEAIRCAEEHKESRRGKFRDLLDELGYVPSGGPSLMRRIRCINPVPTPKNREVSR